MTKRIWTQKEVLLLRRMREEGASLGDIARVLGRSVASVYHQARRQGMEFPPAIGGRRWTPDEDRVLLRHYPAVSVAEIATRLGRTERSVRERANRLGLSRKGSEGFEE